MASDKEKDRSLDGGSGSYGAAAASGDAQSSKDAKSGTSSTGSTAGSPAGKDTGTSGKTSSSTSSASTSGKSSDTSGKESGSGGKTSAGTSGSTSDKEGDRSLSGGSIGGTSSTSDKEGDRSLGGAAAAESASKSAATSGLSAGIGSALSKSFGEVGAGLGTSAATAAAAGVGGLGSGAATAAKEAQYQTSKAVAETGEAARAAQLAGLATGIGAGLSDTIASKYGDTAQTISSALQTIQKAEGATYNTLSGGATADLSDMTIAEAMEFAKTSWPGKVASVIGAYQIKDTTLPIAAEYAGLPLDAKMTPEVQDQLAIGLMRMRAEQATVDGVIDVDKYAAGLAKEWASLPTKSGLSHYADNGIDKATVGYDTTLGLATSLAASGMVGKGAPAMDGGTPAVEAEEPTSFATTYLGHTPQGGIEDSANKYDRQIAQETSFFGAPVDHVDRGVQPNMPSTVPATKSNPNPVVSPSTTSTSVPPSSSAQPVPPSSSAQPVKPSTPETVKPATPETVKPTDTPLSTGQTIAALGIDVGLGLVPGIGMGLSLVNGALMLTGNDTIGQAIVRGGEGGTVPSYNDHDNADPALIVDNGTEVEDAPVEEVAEDDTDSFVSTYLDTTVRPTPAEKWDSGYSSTYGYSEYG